MLSGIKFDSSTAGGSSSSTTRMDSHSPTSSHKSSSKSKSEKKDRKKKEKSQKKKHSKESKKHKKKNHHHHRHSSSSSSSSESGEEDSNPKKKRKIESSTPTTTTTWTDSISPASSSSDEDEEETVDHTHPLPLPHHAAATTPASTEPKLVRDSWMNPIVRTAEEKEQDRLKQIALEEAKLAHQQKLDAEEAERKRIAAEGGLQGRHRLAASSTTSTTAVSKAAPAPVIGDGGAGWRAKALKRARERAEEEGKSVKEVVAERGIGGDNFSSIFQRESDRGRMDTTMSDVGLPSAFGKSRSQHRHEDADTSMEMVETEEEEATRLSKANPSSPISSHRPVQTELSRLMKKPTLATPSVPAASPPNASSSATTTSSSWRDKLKKNLTATAAPDTPSGEVAKLYSTPSASQLSRPSQPVTPSPLPSPSPSPSPHSSSDPQRFAGMLTPSSLGLDRAPLTVLDVAMEDRSEISPSTLTDADVSVPQFAAAFLPVTSSPSPPPSAPVTSATAAMKSASSQPTGASAAELNKLSAQAQVAKLKKNMTLYNELQQKIAELKAANTQAEAIKQVTHDATTRQHAQLHPHHSILPTHEITIDEKLRLLQSEGGASASRTAGGHEIVVLSHDVHGRPLSLPSGAASSSGPQRDPTLKNKKLAPNINESGERVAFFADDVKQTTLSELVQKEKLARQAAALGIASTQHHDMDRDYAKSIMRDSTFKLGDTDTQFDDADFSMSKYDLSTSIKNQKRSTQEQETRQRSQQIHQLHKHESMIERCWYCLQGSKDIVKSLILSIGVRCYLAIPRVNWITPGHCCIIPIEHTLAQTHMEDDMYEEVQYFKKHLQLMFQSFKPSMKCVFIETVYDLGKKRHTLIECIPLTPELYQDAEMYFVKAINESDEEWAQNKKLIKFTSERGGVRQAIPKNFNYFSVEFGTQDGGLAHTIEDVASFPEQFGKEVLLGMLEESAPLFLRHKRAGATEEQKRVKDFLATWTKFDWTQKLSGGAKAAENTTANGRPTTTNTTPAAATSTK